MRTRLFSVIGTSGKRKFSSSKPIIAIANSFTQFVPGHVHLHDVGQRVKKVIDAAGGWGVEFNTIAVDDGIAMGHAGMLYSLPSRDLIADSVEYMVNAHCADALVCISNCDKITPGMLLAAMRLNLEAGFVNGNAIYAPFGGTVNELVALADASLGTDPYTPSGHPARAYQEFLKDSLDALNNGDGVVSPTPCKRTFSTY